MRTFYAINFGAMIGAVIVSLGINAAFQRQNEGRLKACEVEFFGSDGTPQDRDTVSDQLRDQQNEIYQLQLALAKEIEQSDTRWDVLNGHIHNLQESVDNLSAKIPPADPWLNPQDKKLSDELTPEEAARVGKLPDPQDGKEFAIVLPLKGDASVEWSQLIPAPKRPEGYDDSLAPTAPPPSPLAATAPGPWRITPVIGGWVWREQPSTDVVDLET